jgi:hypothetical protein
MEPKALSFLSRWFNLFEAIMTATCATGVASRPWMKEQGYACAQLVASQLNNLEFNLRGGRLVCAKVQFSTVSTP